MSKIKTFKKLYKESKKLYPKLVITKYAGCNDYGDLDFTFKGFNLSCIEEDCDCEKCPIKKDTPVIIFSFSDIFIVKHSKNEKAKLVKLCCNMGYERESEKEFIDDTYLEYPLGDKFVSYEEILKAIKEYENEDNN